MFSGQFILPVSALATAISALAIAVSALATAVSALIAVFYISPFLALYLVFDVLYFEALQVEKNSKKLLQGQKLVRENKTYQKLNDILFNLWG